MKKSLIIVALFLWLTGCALPQKEAKKDGGLYQNSALSRGNLAPQLFQPPLIDSKGEATIDKTYLGAQSDYHFALGEAYSHEGDPQRAIEEFRHVLVYDSDTVMVRLRLAMEYVRAGRVTEAIEHAKEALKLDSKNVDAHLLLGGLYSAMKVYRKAELHYAEVLELEPLHREATLYLGALWAEQKQYQDAKSHFLKAAQNPQFENRHLAFYYLARVFLEQTGLDGANKKAQNYLEKSIDLDPSFEESTLLLGRIYVNERRLEAATKLLADFQSQHGPTAKVAELLGGIYRESHQYQLAYEQFQIVATERPPSDLNIQLTLASLLIELKEYEASADLLENILRQAPEADKVRFYLGAVYDAMNEPEAAVEEYIQIPISSHFFQDAILQATRILKTVGQEDQAIQLIRQSLGRRGDIVEFYGVYASLIRKPNEHKEALKTLQKAVKKYPQKAQLHFYLGSIYDQLGDTKNTIASMKQVLEINQEHVQALNYLAYTFAENNLELDYAEDLVRRALKFSPDDGYILDTLGWVLYKKAQYREAIKVLEAAYKKQKSESIIAEHLGDAYYDYQMLNKARQMYIKAAQIEKEEAKLEKLRSKILAIEEQFEIQEQKAVPNRAPASAVVGER